MSRLLDRRHEHVAQLLFAGKTAEEASRGAGYPDGTSFRANAKKRAGKKDIKARVAELQDRAAEAAEVDKTFILLGLKDDLKCNLSAFMPRDENLRRRFNLDQVDDAMIDRLSSISYHKSGAVAKIEKPSRSDILMKIAKIAGIDRDQTADALTGIGHRLAAALKRVAAQKSG